MYKLHFAHYFEKQLRTFWSCITVGMLTLLQLQGINRFNTLTACDHWPEVNFYKHAQQWKSKEIK